MDYKDKIRKLLALAKSPEPEEAKLALLKARKLMAEHKLTERDLEERNTTVIKRAIGETFSKKANSWMDPLSIIIGENYCCSAFRCKISAKIPLDALARFEFTCPDCKKVSYGRTNVEDAEIVNEKFSCVCGRSIPKLTWNPAKRCYTT